MKLYVEELESRNVYSAPIIPKPVPFAVQVEQAFDSYIASLDQDAADSQKRTQSLPVVDGVLIKSTPAPPLPPKVIPVAPPSGQRKEITLVVNYTSMFTKPVVKFEFPSIKLSR